MKIDDKVDAVYIPDSPSRIKANDYNQIKNEIQDCITEAGLTPTKDVIQLPQALKILTAQSAKTEVDNAINSLQMIKWVDTLPATGETKYLYAVARNEVDKDGNKIAALYLWDGTEWRGAGAFSLNIDPATLATKTDLTNYLPLTGGTLSGRIEINTAKDGKISLFHNNNFIGSILANGTSSSPNLVFVNNTGGSIGISHGSGIFLKRENMQMGSPILCNADKAVANGVASLDANAKVPSEQIPVATASTLGGVKPDGTTITVTADGTISAAISGEEVATKADLQAQATEFQQELSGKANTNLDNIPSNYDYVVESKTPTADDPTWYRKYKSGWLEQGGLAYSASGETVVTLLKPYADTGFAIIATNEQMSNINAYGWNYISSKTITSFTIKSRKGNGEAVTCNAMWEAKGQGAN